MSAVLLSNGEQAFKTHFEASSLTIKNVYTGQGNENKEAPCIIISGSGDAPEAIPNTGNYEATFKVEIKQIPGTTATALATANTNSAEVFALLWSDSLCASLSSSASDFTAFGVTGIELGAERTPDAWIESATVKLLCCPSDIS